MTTLKHKGFGFFGALRKEEKKLKYATNCHVASYTSGFGKCQQKKPKLASGFMVKMGHVAALRLNGQVSSTRNKGFQQKASAIEIPKTGNKGILAGHFIRYSCY